MLDQKPLDQICPSCRQRWSWTWWWGIGMRIKTRFPPSRRFAEVQEHKRGFCHIFSSVLLRLLRVLGQCLWTRVSISLDTFFLVLLRSLQQNWKATPRRRKQSTRPARAATNCKRNIVHPKRSLQTIEVLTSYLYKHLKYEHLTSKMGNSVDPDSFFSSSTGSCDLYVWNINKFRPCFMHWLKKATFDLSKNLPESMKAREDIEEMRGSVVGLVHHVGLVHQAVGCHEGSSMADHRHRATLPNLN